MGKFVLSEIKERIAQKALAVKTMAKFQMAGGMSLVTEKLFGFYKLGLARFKETDYPNGVDRWYLNNVVIPAIDEKYNLEARNKLNEIVGRGFCLPEDLIFIEKEVVPYFDDNCKRLTGKSLEMIGLPSMEEKSKFEEDINKQVSKGKKVDQKLNQRVVEDITGATKIR